MGTGGVVSKVHIWQCKDWCCEDRPYEGRWWIARSEDFSFYEMVPTWRTAVALTRRYLGVNA